MNYPLISEYIEALKSAEDNFKELSYLKPVLGDDGLPVMTSGNFAVVFKMKDEQSGKFFAVKCFTKEQEGRAEAYREIANELKDVSSPYLVSIKYLEKELFVDTDQTTETEFPVLLMDWVEGKTLDKYLRENLEDKYALEMLAYRFSQLAQWLIPQPFAHGDLKPDNILVREDGSLVLVDYDGMYVPAMKGQKARELGSPDFRHPSRTEDDFDEHIDNFSFVSILLSLKAISVNPKLIEEYGNSSADRLLLSEKDYRNLSCCFLIKALFPSKDKDLNNLICAFILYIGNYYLDLESDIWCIHIEEMSIVNTNISCNELCDRFTDTWGTEYCNNKKCLCKIGVPKHIVYFENGWKMEQYDFANGLRIICDRAFARPLTNEMDTDLGNLPTSIYSIGDYAFQGIRFFMPFNIPVNLVYMGKNPFALTECLEIECYPKGYYVDYRKALYTEDRKKLIHYFGDNTGWCRIPDGVETIGEYSFSRKIFRSEYQHYVSLPDSIKVIEDFAFMNYNVIEIRMPKNIKRIGTDIFKNCINLRRIVIPIGTLSFFLKSLPYKYHKILMIENPIDNYDIQIYSDYVDELETLCNCIES